MKKAYLFDFKRRLVHKADEVQVKFQLLLWAAGSSSVTAGMKDVPAAPVLFLCAIMSAYLRHSLNIMTNSVAADGLDNSYAG